MCDGDFPSEEHTHSHVTTDFSREDRYTVQTTTTTQVRLPLWERDQTVDELCSEQIWSDVDTDPLHSELVAIRVNMADYREQPNRVQIQPDMVPLESRQRKDTCERLCDAIETGNIDR